MHASARVVAVHDRDRGCTSLPTLRSEVPLVLRQTPDAVYLVGGAAGPLGGDLLELDIDVGDHADLVLRSAAAVLAQPGPLGGSSLQRTIVRVGRDASLVMRLEPMVSVVGSDHRIDIDVALHPTSRLVLVEELVLGRHAEASGRVATRLRVERDGQALLTHELDLGGDAPAWSSSVVLGGARAVVQQLLVGPDAPTAVRVHRDDVRGTYAAFMPLAAQAAMLLALAPSLLEARAAAVAVGGATASRSGAPSR